MKEMGFQVAKNRWLRNAADAIHYCTQEQCPARRDGCAVDCPIRKHFKIPPHGPKFPDTEDDLSNRRPIHAGKETQS